MKHLEATILSLGMPVFHFIVIFFSIHSYLYLKDARRRLNIRAQEVTRPSIVAGFFMGRFFRLAFVKLHAPTK